MENMLVIGGDARSLEVIQHFHTKGKNIHVIGFDHYDFKNDQITTLPATHTDFSFYDIVILLVQGTGENGEVPCPYADQTFTLTKDKIDSTPNNCTIFTGIANAYLKDITKNRQLEPIFSRDDIAIYNAIPTAEATLQIAIEHTDVTIHGSPVAVLGYGRVGFTVAKLFKEVGADVTVFARSDADFAKGTMMGIQVEPIQHLSKKIGDFSICINTIPANILNVPVISQMLMDSLIIDLASKPGGTDFEAAVTHGIHAIHALGLPGKTAPKTAGAIIASTIEKIISS